MWLLVTMLATFSSLRFSLEIPTLYFYQKVLTWQLHHTSHKCN